MGRVIILSFFEMPVKLGRVRYISNVFGHVYKCCFSLLFFFTSTSCIGVTLVDTYVVEILIKSWMPESLLLFFFPFVFVHVRKDVSPDPSWLFFPFFVLEQSLLPSHTSSRSHQIKFLMARHPFKNPLKALVTFQATYFVFFYTLN